MRRTVLFFAIVLSFVATSFADVARPDKPVRPKKSIETSLYIRLDRDAKEARLIIPRDQIKQLRAELDQFDNGASDNSAAVTGSFTQMQTIVSGTLLSLAFVFAGMWFVRWGGQNSKAVVTAAVLLTVGSIANLVYGNAGPPPEARTITGRMFTESVHMYNTGWGEIKLEVSDTEDYPELIVPDPPRKADE